MVGRVLPTAMCVRGVDDLCVLQFTLINAAGCALHRRTSRVIHRIELYFLGFERRRGQLPTCFHADRYRSATMRATRDPWGPTRRHRQTESEEKEEEEGRRRVSPPPSDNGRDDRSCEAGHPRGPYTARRLFNPPGRVSSPGQDAQLRIDPKPAVPDHCHVVAYVRCAPTREAHVNKGVFVKAFSERREAPKR